MRYRDDFSDERHKCLCLYCAQAIVDIAVSRDHVPTKSLLTSELRKRGAEFDFDASDPDGYLPQVLVCEVCNLGFAKDESYLLCVLHAVVSGSLYPDAKLHPKASSILRSNRHIVRQLKTMPDGQLWLFSDLEPFTIYPDMERIRNVVIKNAKGHAYFELGEPMLNDPTSVWISPMSSLSDAQREKFENFGSSSEIWPEVGLSVVRTFGTDGCVN